MFGDEYNTRLKLLRKIEKLSTYYNKMSFLMLQLKQSLEHETKGFSNKQFKEYLKNNVSMDFDKLGKLDIAQTLMLSDIKTNKTSNQCKGVKK